MPADTSDLLKAEVSALRSFREKPTPFRTWPDANNNPFGDVLRLLQECRYKAKRITRGQAVTQNETLYDKVRELFTFPFEMYPYQIDVMNKDGPLSRQAEFMWPGTGKTATATHVALYKWQVEKYDGIVVIVPPNLVSTWVRWFAKVKFKDGRSLDVTAYSGTPKKREKIRIGGDIVVVPLTIFKLDFDRFALEYSGKRMVTILDEAQSIKNVNSGNHSKLEDWLGDGHAYVGLTGTPLSTPVDAYGHCKLKSPGLYRNEQHFLNVHVLEYDFFKNPETFQNIPMLFDNMRVNASFVRREDAKKDLPVVTYTPIYYQLDPAHYKLYQKVADEQLIEIQNKVGENGKVDLTTAQALLNALKQLVMNWGHFSQNEKNKSAGISIVDDIMDELGKSKLMVFGQYRLTNGLLLNTFKEKYKAVAMYGDIKRSEQMRNVDRFIDDPDCRLFIGQPQTAGVGLDGFQHVCADQLYVEVPAPIPFTQAVARVDRDGQELPVNVRVAIAERTLQVRSFNNLLKKEELIADVTGSVKSLRDLIFGG